MPSESSFARGRCCLEQWQKDQLEHQKHQTEHLQTDDGEEDVREDQFGQVSDRLLRVQRVIRRFADGDREHAARARGIVVFVFIVEDILEVNGHAGKPDAIEAKRFALGQSVRSIDPLRDETSDRWYACEQTTRVRERLVRRQVRE